MTTLKLTIKDWQDILDNTIEKSKSKDKCAKFLREFAKKFKIEFVG
jgi:intergrase/recombinase